VFFFQLGKAGPTEKLERERETAKDVWKLEVVETQEMALVDD
jgi:hypothetical protein